MIVVADDDPLVQQTCKLCLEAAGLEVALAENGSDALKVIREKQVSALLIDVFMPDMDGIETLLSVKRESPSTPVIVMTGGGARSRMDFLDAAKRLGADAVVQKPFTADQLVSVVKEHTTDVWRI